MTWPMAPAGAILGLQPDAQILPVMNRTGGTRAVGDLVMFDLGSTDADSTTFIVGATTSVYANVILAATAGLVYGWYGIVTTGGADNTQLKVCVRGQVKANVSGADAAALTDVLSSINAQDHLSSNAATVDNTKILGRPLEVTTGAGEQLIWILFNGIEGIGHAAV